MTATATKPALAAEYPMPWTKGAYVARIVGPSGRYGLEREFADGKTNKREQRITYTLTAGWYEIRTGTNKPRELIAVDHAGQVHEMGETPTDTVELRKLGKAGRRGDTIDTPGGYRSIECWCGKPAETVTPDTGRARCADHETPGALKPRPPKQAEAEDPGEWVPPPPAEDNEQPDEHGLTGKDIF